MSFSSFISFVDEVSEVIRPSTPLMLLRLMSSVTWVKSSAMHVNALIALPMKSKRPLFFFLRWQGEDDEELPPRFEIIFSTSFLTFSTEFNVLFLRELVSDFQEFKIGMRAMISDETDDTLDVARTPSMVVVAGGRVIGVADPSMIMGTVLVTPFWTTVEVTTIGTADTTGVLVGPPTLTLELLLAVLFVLEAELAAVRDDLFEVVRGVVEVLVFGCFDPLEEGTITAADDEVVLEDGTTTLLVP